VAKSGPEKRLKVTPYTQASALVGFAQFLQEATSPGNQYFIVCNLQLVKIQCRVARVEVDSYVPA